MIIKNTFPKKIRAMFTFCFYKVDFYHRIDFTIYKTGEIKDRWSFKLHPRKINIALGILIFSPIIILIVGIRGIKIAFRESMQIQSFSSYRLYLTKGENPSKWQAYQKS